MSKSIHNYEKNDSHMTTVLLLGAFAVSILVIIPLGSEPTPQIQLTMISVLILMWAMFLTCLIIAEGRATRNLIQARGTQSEKCS